MLNTGVSQFEFALMLPGFRRKLKKALKDGTLDVVLGLDAVSWLTHKFEKASKKEYKPFFGSLTGAFESTADLITFKEEQMAKFELGITIGEITGMLPVVLSEAWEAYSDDKKISVDEGVDLVATILNLMAGAADDEEVKAFFAAQSAALSALVPLLAADEVVDPPTEPPTDPPA